MMTEGSERLSVASRISLLAAKKKSTYEALGLSVEKVQYLIGLILAPEVMAVLYAIKESPAEALTNDDILVLLPGICRKLKHARGEYYSLPPVVKRAGINGKYFAHKHEAQSAVYRSTVPTEIRSSVYGMLDFIARTSPLLMSLKPAMHQMNLDETIYPYTVVREREEMRGAKGFQEMHDAIGKNKRMAIVVINQDIRKILKLVEEIYPYTDSTIESALILFPELKVSRDHYYIQKDRLPENGDLVDLHKTVGTIKYIDWGFRLEDRVVCGGLLVETLR